MLHSAFHSTCKSKKIPNKKKIQLNLLKIADDMFFSDLQLNFK